MRFLDRLLRPSIQIGELDELRYKLAREREATRHARIDAIDQLAKRVIDDLRPRNHEPEPKT